MWNSKSNTKSLKEKYFEWYKRTGFGFSYEVPNLQGFMAGVIFLLLLIACLFLSLFGAYLLLESGMEDILFSLLLWFLAFFTSYFVFVERVHDYPIRRYVWKMRHEVLSKREEELCEELNERKCFNQLRLNARKEGAFDKSTHTGKFLARINKSFGRDIFQKLKTSELEKELQEIQELRDKLPGNSVEVQISNGTLLKKVFIAWPVFYRIRLFLLEKLS